jgi:hypothetical protein
MEQGGRRFSLVSCDVLAVNNRLAEDLALKAGALGIPAGNFFIAATHTHSGPCGLSEGDEDPLSALIMGRPDPALIQTLKDRVVSALEKSVKNMKPCGLSSAAVKSPGIGSNRNDPAKPGDPCLSVLIVETGDGERALVYSAACHPTVLNAKNLLVSADFPGETSRLLERGAVKIALFLNGSAGDISTRYTRRGGGFDEVRRLGSLLERQVTEAAGKAEGHDDPVLKSGSISVNLRIRRAPDPEESLETLKRLRAEFEAAKAEGRGDLRLLEARCEGAALGLLYSRHHPPSKSRAVTVRFLQAGQLVFAFFPVELFSTLSNPLREQAPRFTPVSYAGGYLGYLPDGAIADTDNYEKYTTIFAYGEGERLMAEVKRRLGEGLRPPAIP